MDPLKTLTDLPGGMVGKIYADESPVSPRVWDNLGTCVMFHTRYSLPNESGLNSRDFNDWKEMEAHILKELDAVVCIPVLGYDHGGLTISTGSSGCFSDRWDSGQLGFIYVTRERVIDEYGDDSAESIDKARQYLEGEVKTFDQYLTGDVYGYRIVALDGEELDSCWSYYGEEAVESAVRESAKWYAEERAKEAAKLQLAMFPPFPFYDRFPVLAIL